MFEPFKNVRRLVTHDGDSAVTTKTCSQLAYVVATAIVVTAGLAGTGCAASNKDMLHFLQEHKNKSSAIEYRVGIPDVISINAPRIEEIDREVQRIQPDGKINLQLIGEVKIVGMTAKEIAAKLEVLLGRYYVDPKVNVRITQHASRKYYVYGQANQGPRDYTGRDTLVDAVMTSGVTLKSWTSRVKIIRPAHDGKPIRTLTVNMQKMLKEGDWTQNILLEPDDVVYIPPTPLAWLGLKINELLFPVYPAVNAYVAPAEFKFGDDAYNPDFRRAGFGGRGSGRGRGRR